jgi:hypothetical protein
MFVRLLKTLSIVAVSAPPCLMVLAGCTFTPPESIPPDHGPGVGKLPRKDVIFCAIDAGGPTDCATPTEEMMGIDIGNQFGDGFWANRSSKYALDRSDLAMTVCGDKIPRKVLTQGPFPEGNAVCVNAEQIYEIRPGEGLDFQKMQELPGQLTETCRVWCEQHHWIDGDGNEYRCNDITFTAVKAPTLNACTESGIYRADAKDLRHMPATNVHWRNAGGVQTAGSNLTRIATTPDWEAGAAGDTDFTIDERDGYVEFTADVTTTLRALGFTLGKSLPDTNINDGDIFFAVYLKPGGVLEVKEGGAGGAVKFTTSYAEGDRIRIAVTGGVVQYFSQGLLFYTSDTPFTYPMHISASIFTNGGKITNVVTTF